MRGRGCAQKIKKFADTYTPTKKARYRATFATAPPDKALRAIAALPTLLPRYRCALLVSRAVAQQRAQVVYSKLPSTLPLHALFAFKRLRE